MRDLSISKETYLRETLLTCRVMLKYILICGCIVNLLMLSTPLYSMQVLDRVLSSYNLDTLLMLSLVIILALILLVLIQGARSFAMNMMGNWFEEKLSSEVFANSIRMSNESRAFANSQQLRDLQTIKTYMTSPGLVAIMDTPWALIFIVVLFILHVYIGALTVIGGALLILVGIVADRATKPLLESNNENFIKSMRNVEQATRNAEVVQVMGLLSNINSSWQKLNKKIQATQALFTSRQAIFSELTKFLRMLLQIMVTALGAYLVLKGEFSSGAIIASSSLVGRALAPFEVAITSWKGFVNSRKAYQRLNEPFVKYKEVEKVMSLPEPKGQIEVENAYYSYQGSIKHCIKGVNFDVEPGEALAIVGASASGKTSLVKLIVGIYNPAIGSVRLDGACLKDWNKQELGQYIGYVPQDIELFSGTIKDNIARMNPDANAEDVIEAAQITGVHNMILQLPKAYDTEIGIDGSALSGGQKQRIALARAFYGNPKLIVLDEPNSSLDQQGEEALSVAIGVAKERKITTIIISHRFAILALADKILCINEGMVTKFGSKKEVMDQMKNAQQQKIL